MKRIVSLAAIIACTGVLVCGATKKNVKANENPFMAPYTAKYEIPPFEKIKLAHYLPALEAGIAQQNTIVVLRCKYCDAVLRAG